MKFDFANKPLTRAWDSISTYIILVLFNLNDFFHLFLFLSIFLDFLVLIVLRSDVCIHLNQDINERVQLLINRWHDGNQNTWMAMSIVSKNAFEFMIETLIWLVSASFFSICCLNVEICSYGDQSHEESHVDILECPQVVHWQPIGWCCSFPLQSAC